MPARTAALIGLRIQDNQSGFFVNGSNPGGVLTAPGAISNETAQRLSDHWNTEYTGEGAGKIAVLGDGLKFEPMRMSAVDSQLIEQLRWTAEVVCSMLPCAAVQDRRRADAAVPERRDPEPDLLLRLPADR